jgi:hypothetical protein
MPRKTKNKDVKINKQKTIVDTSWALRQLQLVIYQSC